MFGTKHSKTNQLQKITEYKTNEQSRLTAKCCVEIVIQVEK